MSNQISLVYNILKSLDEKGILKNLIVVGSWCTYFYKYHFKEGDILPALKTRDIDFDVTFLKKSPLKVDIVDLFKKHGFVIDFKGEGYINLVHQDLMVEFLSLEKGKGQSEPYNLPGFGITASPVRFLSLIEEETIIINYENLLIRLPDPSRFAIHKLIVSERRPSKSAHKAANDVKQSLAVWDMLINMAETEKLKKVLSSIPKGWLKIVKQALSKKDELKRLDILNIK